MPLENQVCSLELANRLKELGVEQESLYFWIKPFDSNEVCRVGDKADLNNNADAISRGLEPFYNIGPSAFTVAELGELLPNTEDCISRREPNHKEWRCGNQIENTEADARAKILIYILENDLLTKR